MRSLMETTRAGVEFPRYRCHKEVRALKIAKVERVQPTIGQLEEILRENPTRPRVVGALITPVNEGFAPFEVSQEYMMKHDPQPGGYFVIYADGYESFSPEQAFEEGYTRL